MNGVVSRFGLNIFNNVDAQQQQHSANQMIQQQQQQQRLIQLEQHRDDSLEASVLPIDPEAEGIRVAELAALNSLKKIGFHLGIANLPLRNQEWHLKQREIRNREVYAFDMDFYKGLVTSVKRLVLDPSAVPLLPPALRLQALGGPIVREVHNWLLMYSMAPPMPTEHDHLRTDPANLSDTFINNLRCLVPAFKGNGIDDFYGRSVFDVITVVLLFVLYPAALRAGWRGMTRAITMVLLNLSAFDWCETRCADAPYWLLQILPSLDRTAVDVCEVIATRATVFQRTQKERLGFLMYSTSVARAVNVGPHHWTPQTMLSRLPFIPATSLVDNKGATVALSDPFDTMATMVEYATSPARAPLVFMLFTSSWLRADFYAKLPPGTTPNIPYENHSLCLTPVQVAMAKKRPFSSGSSALNADGTKKKQYTEAETLEYEQKRHSAVMEIIQSPTNLLLSETVRPYLPLCAIATLERGTRAGELHNQDRWWMTAFTNDTLGHDTTDIEDLVSGFETLCRRNFPIKHAGHVRAQHVHYETTVKEQKEKGRPPFGIISCAAMKKPYFAPSERRASTCPFVPDHNKKLGGEDAILRLIQWQVGNSNVTKESIKPILDGVKEGNPGSACLAHWNWLNARHPGHRGPPRETEIVYPPQFVHFQAIRHAKKQ